MRLSLPPLSRCVAFGIITTVLLVANAKAQDAEPRLYTNTPVGLNFLIGGYLYSEGKIAFDPSSPITDAQFNSQTGVLAYVRSLDVAGKSAKFDVILPYSPFFRAWSRGRPVSSAGDVGIG